MFTLPTQPQTIGETLDTGFKLYFKSFKKIFFISLIMNSMWLINTLVYGAGTFQKGLAAEDVFGAISLIIGILSFYLIFQIVIIHRINNIAHGTSTHINESFQLGLKIFLPMLFATILNALILVVGMILLIIPGIAMAIYLMLFPIAMVTESCGPMNALQRSMELVKKNWWRSFLILSVVMVVYSIIYSVIGIIFGVSMAMNPPEDVTDYAFWLDVIGVAIGTILGPLAYSMLISLFNNLKIRHEAVDIEARLNEME